MDGYARENSLRAWPLVIQFIQISTNYAMSPMINGGHEAMPVERAAFEVWRKWYDPRLWEESA